MCALETQVSSLRWAHEAFTRFWGVSYLWIRYIVEPSRCREIWMPMAINWRSGDMLGLFEEISLALTSSSPAKIWQISFGRAADTAEICVWHTLSKNVWRPPPMVSRHEDYPGWTSRNLWCVHTLAGRMLLWAWNLAFNRISLYFVETTKKRQKGRENIF